MATLVPVANLDFAGALLLQLSNVTGLVDPPIDFAQCAESPVTALPHMNLREQ